jgi:hypothetical protein
MKHRHIYLVIQDDRDTPCISHNSTQRHVLGVFSNLAKANAHLESCKRSRVERGYLLIRDDRYNPEHMHGITRKAYLSKPSGTSELIIEKRRVS